MATKVLHKVLRVCLWLAAVFVTGYVRAEMPRIIVDTDMYTDIDSGAVALAHVLADAGECELLGVVSCTGGSSPAAGVIRIINAVYGRPDLPVGAPHSIFVGPENDRHMKGRGVEKYCRHIKQYVNVVKERSDLAKYVRSDEAPDVVEVYRRILAAQPDDSVTICTIGLFTGIRLLLESKPDSISPLNGRELVARKVKRLFAMACTYPKGIEYNAIEDAISTAITLHSWPKQIVFLDFNYGYGIRCGVPMAQMPKDTYNPVRDIYAEAILSGKPIFKDKFKVGHPAWDELTVLMAVRGWEKYCTVVRGRFEIIANNGENRWTDDPNGPHLVVQEKMPRTEVIKIVDELLTRYPKHGLGAKPSK